MNEPTAESSGQDLLPVSITRDGESAIVIEWNDATTTRWTVSELRKACPCATCREKRRGDAEKKTEAPKGMLPVLSAAEAQPLRIDSMQPVGSYAYSIAFSDGHASGIFTMPLLHNKALPSDYKTTDHS